MRGPSSPSPVPSPATPVRKSQWSIPSRAPALYSRVSKVLEGKTKRERSTLFVVVRIRLIYRSWDVHRRCRGFQGIKRGESNGGVGETAETLQHVQVDVFKGIARNNNSLVYFSREKKKKKKRQNCSAVSFEIHNFFLLFVSNSSTGSVTTTLVIKNPPWSSTRKSTSARTDVSTVMQFCAALEGVRERQHRSDGRKCYSTAATTVVYCISPQNTHSFCSAYHTRQTHGTDRAQCPDLDYCVRTAFLYVPDPPLAFVSSKVRAPKR